MMETLRVLTRMVATYAHATWASLETAKHAPVSSLTVHCQWYKICLAISIEMCVMEFECKFV